MMISVWKTKLPVPWIKKSQPVCAGILMSKAIIEYEFHLRMKLVRMDLASEIDLP
jgi:hypothetical protein